MLAVNEIPGLPWTLEAVDRCVNVAAHLQQTGMPIGEMDTQNATHALAQSLTWVTRNTRQFKRVSGLRLEDWMA